MLVNGEEADLYLDEGAANVLVWAEDGLLFSLLGHCSIEELVAKSEPLADFKAVQNGNVWCTGKSMFQESQSVGSLILDIHAILTGEDEGGLVHLHRLV